MRPRTMVDGQLRDAEAAVVREDGNEPVQLPVERHAVHDLCAVGLEAAVHVVQPQARDPARDRVEDA